MNMFKNCGRGYRAVVLTPDVLGSFTLTAVFNRDRESTHQMFDPETHTVVGIIDGRLQVATPEKARQVTWADPTLQAAIKQLPWLRDWILNPKVRGIPESVVPARDYVVAEIRRSLALETCNRWRLPRGVTEVMVANADSFHLRTTTDVADFRHKELPAGTLLYGVAPGKPAERIPVFEGCRLAYGYPTLVEVCPAKGLLTVHKNPKRRQTAQDWRKQFEYQWLNRKVSYCPD